MLANRIKMGIKRVYDSFTKTLLHFDIIGAGFDSIGVMPWTYRGAFLTGTPPKFGLSSGIFNTTDYIDTPMNSSTFFGSNNFTIDFWVKCNSTSVAMRFCGQGDSISSANSISIAIGRSGSNQLIISYSGYADTSTLLLADTNWHHIAVVRSDSNFVSYVDGIQATASILPGGGPLNTSTNKFSIGRHGEDGANPLIGNIDEFRISVGVARWTANFTPPTAPY
jgi:hypothetical protein